MPQLDIPPNLEILDHLPQGMFILRKDETVAFWNHCLEDWTGILKSAIVGTSIKTYFPHLGTPKYTSRFEPLFKGGPPATFASQFHSQFVPCSLPNGQPRIQQTIAKGIWDEPTREWRALVIIQDISHLHRQVAESQRLRKQAQTEIADRKQVEEGKAHLQRAIDQGIEGLALLDQEGKYTYCNQAHAVMYGYTVDELMGQSWKILYTNDQSAYMERICFPHIRKSGIWQGELFGLRKDGTNFPVEISLALLTKQDNSSSGLVCTCHDITERKQAESVITRATHTLERQNRELKKARDQALAAARSKTEFLARMSHEIRTPLNGVIGMTDLLMGTDLEADQREMAETVKNSGEFLLTIINDILDFSKMDAEKLNLEKIDFDIRTAVDEVMEILTERADSKGLELISLIDAATPQELRGDPGRIRQVLFNLIGNAIKFTHEGEIVVKVSVVETHRDHSKLRFSVTDTGIGIGPDAQATLFESFTQADSSTTRKFGGTGLGLAICKQLVILMKGEIGVISEQGQGSTFWLTIPLAHGSSNPPAAIPNTTLQGRRLCIVETHDTVRFLLQHYAESWGMVCDVARNRSEGLGLLHERAKQGQPVDVAILDQTISEAIKEDGLSLGKMIRQDPALARTPLILLTSLGQRGDARLAQDAGFNGYLTKPIRHQQLQQCLQMVLDGETLLESPDDIRSPTLITRHTVEEAQARAQIQILLAEDNLVNQKVAVRMLKKLGYRVDVATNGLEAMEALGCTTYDLVLMDCHMPEMDGLEATRKIREALGVKGKANEEISPHALPLTPHKNPRLPIIALTANALPGDRETCLEAGMNDFLAKPVRLEELSTMITKWLPHSTTSKFVAHPVTEKSRKNSTPLSPCLDETIIQNLKALGGEDDPEFFVSVVDQFLTDLPRHLEGIKQAIDHQDTEGLIKAAHTCKGSCRSIGAVSLAEVSYALELMAREGMMEGAAKKFEQWFKEKELTAHALQQERVQSTSEVRR